MTVEELASEPEGGAGRPRGVWTFVTVLLVVAAGAWLALGGSDGAGQSLPTPSPSDSTPSPSPTVQQRPGVADAEFRLGGECDPVVTPRRLQLTFTLVNPDPVDLILLNVEPDLPLPGLEWLRIEAALGGCGQPTGALTELRVPSGEAVVVSFWFELPPTCPQPNPVGAIVTSRVFDVSQSAHRSPIPIYPDLGSIDFATCP